MTDAGRSKTLVGLQIFGWGLIITSLLHMQKLVTDYDFYMDIYSNLGWVVYLRYAFSWLQRIAGLSIGIGLLKEKNWARLGGIILGTFTILTIYWKHPYEAFHKHTLILDQQFGAQLHHWAIPASLTFESVTVLAIIVHCILDVLFWGIFIYYVTRPRVRNRFQ
jgi:hypothetical protein